MLLIGFNGTDSGCDIAGASIGGGLELSADSIACARVGSGGMLLPTPMMPGIIVQCRNTSRFYAFSFFLFSFFSEPIGPGTGDTELIMG